MKPESGSEPDDGTPADGTPASDEQDGSGAGVPASPPAEHFLDGYVPI